MAISVILGMAVLHSHAQNQSRHWLIIEMERNALTTVLLAGQYQNGKSTMINCLLGGKYAIEGDGRHTTACRITYHYSDKEPKYYKISENGQRECLKDGLIQSIQHGQENISFDAYIPSPILKSIALVDAPGWGAEYADDIQAENSLNGIDFVIYLIQPKQFSQEDKNFLRLLKKRNVFFCLILNARDATSPDTESLQDICNAILGTLKQLEMDEIFVNFYSATGICVVNLLWAKYGLHLLDNPRTTLEKRQAQTVRISNGVYGEVDSPMDYDELMTDSGFGPWKMFFESVVGYINKIGVPIENTIQESISSSICSNLINIIRGY